MRKSGRTGAGERNPDNHKNQQFNLNKFILILTLCSFSFTILAQQVRKMKITDLDSYIQHADHPLIVNFWATYCVPCMEEMPAFIDITNRHKRESVELLLVSLDMAKSYPDKITRFAREKGLPRYIVWLEETNADYFCPKIDQQWSGAIPATLFVNQKTGYRKFFEQQISAAQLQKIFAEMLEPSKNKEQKSASLDRTAN